MENSKEIKVRLQTARDVKENWEQNNPVLLPGELALVYNVSDDPSEVKLKIGDGTSTFNELPYHEDTSKIGKDVLGEPSGLATLDEDGKIPVSQLPSDLFTSCLKMSVSLSHLGWVDSGDEEYPYAFYFSNDVFTEGMETVMFVSPESSELALSIGLNSEVTTEDGFVKVLAQSLPKNPLHLTFISGEVNYVNVESHLPTKWLGYYGANRAVLMIPDYDLLILEGDNIGALLEGEKNGKKVLSYVAIAEVVSSRWFYEEHCAGKSFLVEENSTWGSYRTNPASTEWQNVLLNVVGPNLLDEKNYDGVFFDVCDVGEYLEGNWPEQYPGAIQGIATIIQAFKTKWPNKIIACNGGYTPILAAKDFIDYYVTESAIGTWRMDSNGAVLYEDASQDRKNWLYPRIATIKDNGIPILDWEYGEVANEERVYEIMHEADSKGWSPFVTVRSINWFPGLPVPSEGPNTPEVLTPAADKISFKAAVDGEAVNFFEGTGCQLPAANKFKVLINDEETDQEYTSLTFSADDKIDIQLIDNRSYYPMFKPGHWDSSKIKNYIKAILEPFPPFMADSTGFKIDNFANHFTLCSRLESIPEGLYKNNTQATSFYYGFAQTGLTSVPAKVFEGCTAVTSFEACFNGCSKLASVASDLFEYSVNATSLRYCFSNDNQLPTFTLKIGSPNVTTAAGFVTAHWQSTEENRMVLVPAGSVTEATFNVRSFEGALGIVTY